MVLLHTWLPTAAALVSHRCSRAPVVSAVLAELQKVSPLKSKGAKQQDAADADAVAQRLAMVRRS
jgi:hypothetical protein